MWIYLPVYITYTHTHVIIIKRRPEEEKGKWKEREKKHKLTVISVGENLPLCIYSNNISDGPWWWWNCRIYRPAEESNNQSRHEIHTQNWLYEFFFLCKFDSREVLYYLNVSQFDNFDDSFMTVARLRGGEISQYIYYLISLMMLMCRITYIIWKKKKTHFCYNNFIM